MYTVLNLQPTIDFLPFPLARIILLPTRLSSLTCHPEPGPDLWARW